MVSVGKRIVRKIKWHFAQGHLERKTNSFYHCLSRGARVQRIATGFRFTEGPVWFHEGPFLLFSDIPANQIWKLSQDHRVTVFREPSGHSNGLTRDREGRLLACEHGNRRVTRTEKDGTQTIVADTFLKKRLNSPNDIIVKSDGAIYFTDPPYGIKSHQQEQPVQGVYRLSSDGKNLSVVAQDFDRPNGLAFSPDEKKLYIDDSSAQRHIRVFEVQDDGTLTKGQIFHTMRVSQSGSPDGMKVDVNGNLYCTGPGGVWVFDEGGQHLGTIVTAEQPANCAWGDDGNTLFITAETSIYQIRVNIPGIMV